ncbi:MAG TPA: MaoC family dehydratase [Eoetvoesiella sp.]
MNAPIHSMTPGTIRTGKPRVLTMARALALSGGPFDMPGWPDKNLHTDIEAARSTGLSEVVVSGTQWEGHLIGLLVETFGLAWFQGGEVNVKIPRSVRITETVQPKLRLDALEENNGYTLAQLTVWCEDSSGQQILIGTAKCPLSREGGKAI